jgi:hypothetical protein
LLDLGHLVDELVDERKLLTLDLESLEILFLALFRTLAALGNFDVVLSCV